MNMPFVREQGVGPGVVCFHSNCSSSGQFKELMDTLGSHFHVLAFDAYGAGKTPAWSRSTYLSLSDEVALAEAVMLQAGEPVILVGHSYGAAVALMMALDNPARVQAVVVYEPTLFSLVNQVHVAPNGADAMRVVWKASAQAVENGDLDAAASMFIDLWSGEGTWANTPPRHKEAMLVAIRDVDRWGTALHNDPTPLSAFAELACPVLYMIGKDSPLPAHAVADVLVPVLPRVQVIEFEGIGHMGPVTHAAQINAAIVSFVTRLGQNRKHGADLVVIDDDDCERSDTAPPAFKVDRPLAANLEASTSAEHTRRLAEDSEMAKRLVAALGFKADS